MPKLPLSLDDFSTRALPIECSFQGRSLGIATAFFWKSHKRTFLITNWHNVTGINPLTGANLRNDAGRPDKITVGVHVDVPKGIRGTLPLGLFDGEGKARWYVHPQHGKLADIIAIPVNPDKEIDCRPINEAPMRDLAVRIGNDIFILGFPFSKTLLDRAGLPIWKRGSIASEPEVIMADELYVLVDTASRPGMSGAPVIRRDTTGAVHKDGSISLGGGSSFFGIYAGRIETASQLDPQLGRIYPADLIEEIVANEVPEKEVTAP